MKVRIRCEAAGVDVVAELNESATAEALVAILPVEAPASRWGDEVYFTVPMRHPHEKPVEAVQSGDIGFWPPGDAFCVFFGQQPVGPVNPLGKVAGDATAFKQVAEGQLMRLELTGD